MRLCVVVPKSDEDGFDMASYHHVGCFQLPRKYSTGAGKISTLEFLQEHVTDTSADRSILPDKMEELADQMEHATSNKKAKAAAAAAAAAQDDDGGDMTLIARVKAAHQQQQQDEETEPPKKKSKTKRDQKTKQTNDDDAELKPLVESYATHCKSTTERLKELLRYVTLPYVRNESSL